MNKAAGRSNPPSGNHPNQLSLVQGDDAALRARLVPDFAMLSARAVHQEQEMVRRNLAGFTDEPAAGRPPAEATDSRAGVESGELAGAAGSGVSLLLSLQDGSHLWGESQEDRKETVLDNINRLTWAGSRCNACGALSVKRNKVQYLLGLPVCPAAPVTSWVKDYNQILVSLGADRNGLGQESITPKELRCFEFLQPKGVEIPPCPSCSQCDAMVRFICSKKFRCKQAGCSLRKLCKQPRWYCKHCAEESFRPPVVTMKLAADGSYVEDGLQTARDQSRRDAEASKSPTTLAMDAFGDRVSWT